MQYYKSDRDYLCNVVRAEKGYDDNHLYLRFFTASRHRVEICIEKVGQFVKLSSSKLTDGLSLNKLLDEQEYSHDIRKMVGVMAYVSVAGADILYPLGQLLHEHVQKHERILSEDLNTYIAELIIVVNAFSESESGEGLNENGKRNLLSMCNDFVSEEFGRFLC